MCTIHADSFKHINVQPRINSARRPHVLGQNTKQKQRNKHPPINMGVGPSVIGVCSRVPTDVISPPLINRERTTIKPLVRNPYQSFVCGSLMSPTEHVAQMRTWRSSVCTLTCLFLKRHGNSSWKQVVQRGFVSRPARVKQVLHEETTTKNSAECSMHKFVSARRPVHKSARPSRTEPVSLPLLA